MWTEIRKELGEMVFWLALALSAIAFLLTNKRYRWIYILYKTLPRDLQAGYRFAKLNLMMTIWVRNQESIPSLFNKLVKKHPNKNLFYFENESWTIKQLDEFSNQIANYFKSKGYKKEDSIALLLENRPEYVGIWLGLSKIGVTTALINTNLVQDPLIHSITVAHSKVLIYGSDFSKAVSEISERINDVALFEFRANENTLPGSVDLSKDLTDQPKTLPENVDRILPTDKIIYIYTSGTTGLPKAAVISSSRYIFTAAGLYYMINLSPDDIFYNPLPLYHSAGGMLAIGQAILFGVPIALRRKFSATNYWTDCEKYNCTVSNYIGEICRYLLAVHKPGSPIKHKVKKMMGNGLRPQIWKKFIENFKIENVYEFYGSTEGNSNLLNIDNTVGAVGFVPRYFYAIYSVILVRCDESTGEPIRNKEGLCTACKINEPGILVGKINQTRAHSAFAGYADEKATQKKLLRDVFRKGDMYFNSGDVLVQDELGYYYFKDRLGDTFRWKGENVATSEVEAVISNVAGLKDAVVYGVQIPGAEGRAGMAAIVDPDNSLDFAQLAKGLKSRLPSYAIPIFLRIMDTMPMTGTFKLKKVDLQKEGFDCNIIKDHRLYFFDSKSSEYQHMTQELFEDIHAGRIRL